MRAARRPRCLRVRRTKILSRCSGLISARTSCAGSCSCGAMMAWITVLQDLAKMSHEQLVALCVQKQQDRKKAIDKPWVVSVSEGVGGGVDEDIMEMWDVGTRDLRALEDLKKKEDELVKAA